MKGVYAQIIVTGVLVSICGPATVGADECENGVCTVDVSADVLAIQSMSCTMFECPTPEDGCPGGFEATAMDFNDDTTGELLRRNECGDGDDPCALIGAHYYTVWCGINTSGRPYGVRQTSQVLTSGTDTIPSGAWWFTPVECVDYDGDTLCDTPESGSRLGNPAGAPAGQSNILWYRSGAGGDGATIQATYGITDHEGDPPPGGEIVPPDQPAGTYTSTVTWTLSVLP